MCNKTSLKPKEIKKLQLEEVVLFAINNIPQVDSTTLKQFLDLVNAGGTFGTISHEQILRKMHQVLKYIPRACAPSLVILMELLEIEAPKRLAPKASQAGWLQTDPGKAKSVPAFIEAPQPAA